MKKTVWTSLLTLPMFLVLLFLAASTKTLAQEIAQNTPQPSPQPTIDSPITSVSELSDVQPTDWAFAALQLLVERYGCIAGYPDKTYRGNRPLSRYEFAAGLNACLDQISQLIASSTADSVTKEDLATLQRLTEEFGPELAELRGRVDNLEARTAEVEANQFSTTTKLVGDVVFLIADTFGDRANNTSDNDTDDETNTIFSYRARLSFQSSFTGKDQLNTDLIASNLPNLITETGTHMTRFALDRPARFQENDFYLANLYYRFPIGDKATVWVGARTLNFPIYVPTLNPLNGNLLQGGVSRFGQFNPTVYRPGFDGAGAAFAYKFSDQFQLHAAYIADDSAASQPNGGLLNNSSQAIISQLTISPSKNLDIGLTYTHKYYPNNSDNNLTGGTGSAFARNPFLQNATTSDNFGFEFNWKLSQKFNLGGWFGYTLAHQQDGGDSDATIINGALTFGFPDLFKEGNVGGITVGIPPKVTNNDFRVAGQRREDPDTSLHLEAFYRFRVSNNISLTPAFYLITKPEHDDDNDAIWVGAIRTTFNF
ncbi:hypothetical protein AMR41_03130 [Hapalosiphon sp. MRB220]|nr:hypothetical protein AMR41_03130 [Hapalosiphon sp. MRB220]